MTVGYSVNSSLYEIGSSSFLYAFFSNICFHLENKRWGDKYPYLMKKLYQGKLSYMYAPLAIRELEEIKEKLKLFPPEKIVWDIDDACKKPPWGNNISNDITSLSNYFVTSEGKDLIDITMEALEEGVKNKKDITITNV
jgi:hypothetical protein